MLALGDKAYWLLYPKLPAILNMSEIKMLQVLILRALFFVSAHSAQIFPIPQIYLSIGFSGGHL